MDRFEIINEYGKNDFSSFLENDYTGQVLELFNAEGIEILNNSPLKEERINYILTYSNYRNELLTNQAFLDILLKSDISNYYANLRRLDYKTYDYMLTRCLELGYDDEKFLKLFNYFSLDYRIDKISKWPYSTNLLYPMLYDESKIIDLIINKYNIDLTEVNLEKFFNSCKIANLKSTITQYKESYHEYGVTIPLRMINKGVSKKIWETYDIIKARLIINDAAYSTDVSEINKYFKEKEDELIHSVNPDTIFSPYKELYDAFKKYVLEKESLDRGEIDDDHNYRKYYVEYYKITTSLKSDFIANTIQELYDNKGLNAALDYIKTLSDRVLSNYIIDYHFEEVYYNVIIDIKELLRFYYDGNIALPHERIELYQDIVNIDNLSYEDKLKLHEDLKRFNMVETFYDDMAYARKIVGESIKDYSLSRESIKEYEDKELSEQYGVPVYVMGDNHFFGIVKTGFHVVDDLPTGHSFSLIGKGSVAVFGDPKLSKTFLYDAGDMNPEQLVHAFPYDSYTMYRPFEFSSDSTNRVNVLMTPEQLVEEDTRFYNEILLLESGKIETGIDSKIPLLKRLALFCLDEITKRDIEVAERKGVGIILIDSKKIGVEKHTKRMEGDAYDAMDYNYYTGNDLEQFEAKR